MNKRILSSALALCMVGSMLPAAALAAETGPSAIGMTVMGEAAQPDGPALKTTIGNGTPVSLDGISLVASEAVDFQVQDGYGSAQDVIYVSAAADGSATLTARIAAGSSGEIQTASISLTSGDDVTWTGSGSGFAGVSVGALANELGNRAITIPAGGMVSQADGSSSPEAVLRANQDAANVYLMLYPASLEEYTVTYDYGVGTYTFVLPAGSTLTDISLPEQTGEEFEGWYTDEDCTIPAVLNTAVNSNLTLYADFTDTTGTSTFTEALDRGDSILPISNLADFTAFVARADEVTANQRVELQNDLNLEDGSFSAISGFDGDFDGQNYTISNGTFTAVGDNAGMFATLGAGQVVANLTLKNIDVGSTFTTYSGTLVGSAGGVESAGSGQVTIQNVHVTGDGSVSGRTAGGIAGYIIWTDVKYCSVTGETSVSGLVNAGGIVGISYNNVDNCYATVNPFALMRRGGIVGNNLDNASYITYCWCTYSDVYGNTENDEIVETSMVMPSYMTAEDFWFLGFSSDIWNFNEADPTQTTFNAGNIVYEF